jgi:hypothetical protein
MEPEPETLFSHCATVPRSSRGPIQIPQINSLLALGLPCVQEAECRLPEDTGKDPHGDVHLNPRPLLLHPVTLHQEGKAQALIQSRFL